MAHRRLAPRIDFGTPLRLRICRQRCDSTIHRSISLPAGSLTTHFGTWTNHCAFKSQELPADGARKHSRKRLVHHSIRLVNKHPIVPFGNITFLRSNIASAARRLPRCHSHFGPPSSSLPTLGAAGAQAQQLSALTPVARVGRRTQVRASTRSIAVGHGYTQGLIQVPHSQPGPLIDKSSFCAWWLPRCR